MAADNGGGAFVLLFAAILLVVGVPGLMAELALGRHTGRNPVDAFLVLGRGRAWGAAGALGVAASALVLSYYAVIAGWVLAYAWLALAGGLAGQDPAALGQTYTALVQHPWQPIAWQAIFLALTGIVVAGGVRAGIERCSKVLMPGLVVLLLVLAARVLTLDGAAAGLAWLLQPRWDQLSWTALFRALGQVFFSLGLGMGVMITYGSYLGPDRDIHRSVVAVAAADAGIALLAASVVVPALFAFGLPVEGGAGLLFVTLPGVLGRMPLAGPLTVALFVMVGIAALTSAISMLETMVAVAVQRLGWTRGRAALAALGVAFAAGVPSALSQGPGAWRPLGRDVLAWVDVLASDVLLPLAGLLTALFVGWAWGTGPALAELRRGAGWFPERLWAASVALIVPVTVALVLAAGLAGLR
jgi:NSS family neurotransmitter:Na+ symporter